MRSLTLFITVTLLSLLAPELHAVDQDSAMANLRKGKTFLRNNRDNPNITETSSGLQYEILKQGSGKTPSLRSVVVTHYEGTLLDGRVFDSSYRRKEPTTFRVDSVIEGWQEALQMMKEGDKWRIYVPSKLAYKARGSGRKIGPNQTLIFELELINVQ